jgi:hypothetical protein
MSTSDLSILVFLAVLVAVMVVVPVLFREAPRTQASPAQTSGLHLITPPSGLPVVLPAQGRHRLDVTGSYAAVVPSHRRTIEDRGMHSVVVPFSEFWDAHQVAEALTSEIPVVV